MRCKLACVGVLVGVSALVCAAPARADHTTDPSVWPTTDYRTLPSVQPQTQPSNPPRHAQETPTAPLPRALWPGLMILLALGIARITVGANRRMARR